MFLLGLSYLFTAQSCKKRMGKPLALKRSRSHVVQPLPLAIISRKLKIGEFRPFYTPPSRLRLRYTNLMIFMTKFPNFIFKESKQV